MKTIITTFALVALTLFGAAPQAEARSHHHSSRIYISGYRSCGTPIYTERYFVGYDHCGNPIWGTRVLRREYCPVERPRYVEPCRPRYVEPCRPRYVEPCRSGYAGYDGYRGGSSIVIEGSFRR